MQCVLSYKLELFMFQRNEIITHLHFDYRKVRFQEERNSLHSNGVPIKQETKGLYSRIL